MSILIVDDDTIGQQLLSTMLESAGFMDILTSDSADRALEQLSSSGVAGSTWGVDLVLLDIRRDGIEACRQFKKMSHLTDVPVIMITSHRESEDLQAAFDAGAMDYITKPPYQPELLARVKSALRLKQAMDAHKAHERQLLDYVEHVEYITEAAAAVEAASFDPASLAHVTVRQDGLGRLARVFQRMACEVAEREHALKWAAHKLHEECQIKIDQEGITGEVKGICETEFFQKLAERAQSLRTHKHESVGVAVQVVETIDTLGGDGKHQGADCHFADQHPAIALGAYGL